MTFTLLNCSQPLNALDLSAQADMRHADMGTAHAQVTALGHGHYRLTGLDLSMAGDWVLSVSATVQGRPLRGEAAFRVEP